MADPGLQTLISRILDDSELQLQFLANPFPLLEHYDLSSRDIRDLIFWLPLHLLFCAPREDARPVLFTDRADAGRELAGLLKRHQGNGTVVMAIPRGGVAVGYTVAHALDAPLGILPATRLGAPGNEEFAFGAIAPGGVRVLDDRAVRLLGLGREEVDRITASAQTELERRERRFPTGLPLSEVTGKTVLVVDDGVATSVTAQAAIRALRLHNPATLVLAVPVCPPNAMSLLRETVDEFVCVAVPSQARAVGYWYAEYSAVTDAEVDALLEAAYQRSQDPPLRSPKGSRVSSQAPALLRKVSLFSDLDDQALSGLASHLRRRTFRKGTMIFHKDQAGDALYLVESGHVRIFLPKESGEELTPEVAGPGDVFGELALLDGRPRSASAETIDDTTTYVLGRDDFQRYLTATPKFAGSLIALLSARIRQLTDYAESLAYLDIHGRVARALIQMAERHGTKTGAAVEIDFDLTQAELASMIGATRERVNRALSSFRAQGLIELRGKKIVMLDPARLKQRIY